MISGQGTTINNNSLSSLPNMADVIQSWQSEYRAKLITKQMINYELVEIEQDITFNGIVQNLNRKELQLKPDGERNWGWYELHSTRKFNNDDIIEVNNVRYRIMSTRNDDTYYGFYVYELLQSYTD